MDTRADFQRLLEDMDKAVQAKRQELSELDEHLERARSQLSEREAQELKELEDKDDTGSMKQSQKQKLDEYFRDLKQTYEQQLDLINEELAELEGSNRSLMKENQELRVELDSLRSNYEIVRVKSNILIEDLEEVKSANLELNLRLATSEAELQKNRKLLERSHDEDEVLMVAFSEKLETLKREIMKRDDEIQQLRNNDKIALESIGAELSELDTDYPSKMTNKLPLAEIANVIRDKNKQISMLKSKLEQATKDLERNINLSQSPSHHMDQNDQSRSTKESLIKSQEELKQKVKVMDEELEAKDKELNMMEFKMHYYEEVLPNVLSDSVYRLLKSLKEKPLDKTVEEDGRCLLDSLEKLKVGLDNNKKLLNIIENIRSSNKTKDAQIRRLVKNLSLMDAKFNLVQQQCDLLRSKQGSTVDPEVQQLDMELAREFDSGSVDLTLVDSFDTSERIEQFGSSKDAATKSVGPDSNEVSEDGKVKADVADYSKDESDSKITKVGLADQLSENLAEVKLDNIVNLEEQHNEYDRLHNNSNCKQVKRENELLELAMKEILLCIKWSDAKCNTIVIDCPSLDKLCQVIEAKYVADIVKSRAHKESRPIAIQHPIENHVFQVMVLKSELDLMRGQNEQLRADVKTQRREYQKLIEDRLKLKTNFNLELTKREVESQTVENGPPGDGEEHGESTVIESKDKITCETCKKLAHLSSCLLQCITRIESYVSTNDELFIGRLTSLHRLNQLLERDLSARDAILARIRREYQSTMSQKIATETRLKYLEAQMNIHFSGCPLITPVGGSKPLTINLRPID